MTTAPSFLSRCWLRSPTLLCPATASNRRSCLRSDAFSQRRRDLQTLRLDPAESVEGGRMLADAHPKLFLRNKFYFNDVHSAGLALKAWGVDKMPSVTFIDAFAGNGMLSRAALDLPNVARVIAMSPGPTRSPNSKTEEPQDVSAGLEKVLGDLDDPRLVGVSENAYHWITWEALKSSSLLKHVQTTPWSEVNTSLFVAFQLGDNIYSEKLAFQIIQAAFGKLWMFTYGRCQVGFLASDSFFSRATALPRDQRRHKTAVLVENLCDLKGSDSTGVSCEVLRKHKSAPTPKVFRVTPKASSGCPDQLHYDALEFLTRQLFMHPSKPLHESLPYLAPNAQVILDIAQRKLLPIPTNALPSELTQNDWMHLTQAFLAWPFRPKELLAPLMRSGSDEDD